MKAGKNRGSPKPKSFERRSRKSREHFANHSSRRPQWLLQNRLGMARQPRLQSLRMNTWRAAQAFGAPSSK
jgi:hypothetical protein